MTDFRLRALSGFAMVLLSAHLLAEDITRQQAEGLMRECQSERARNIAPLKQQAINDCINKQKKDKDYCETYNRDFGEGPAGGANRGMFWGLPACEKAFNVEKYFRMNPGKEVYSVP